MEVGSQLLLALVQQADAKGFLRYQLQETLFFGSEVEVFKFVASHMAKHHQLPHPDTLAAQFPDLPTVVEPPSYYLDYVEQRFTHKVLNKTLLEANSLMKEQDSWTALAKLEESVHYLRQRSLMQDVIDFRTTGSAMVEEEIRRIKLAGEDIGLALGWPTFDAMSNGLRGGDVVSVIGRPAQGKTWFLVRAAHHMWLRQNKNVLFVSMEMDTLSIAQRLAAINAKVNATHIRVADLSSVEVIKLSKARKGAKKHGSALWLMDGTNHSEVDQIFTLVHQLCPDAVVIDAAYLMGHPDKRMNKYQRVDANVELIKRRTSQQAVPSILSFQFNRDAAKKWKGGKGEAAGLEDIAHSDAIGQVSSAVLAANQDDSVETANQRIIDVLKCRTEKKGRFHVNWDFDQMDFDEVVQVKPGALQFM